MVMNWEEDVEIELKKLAEIASDNNTEEIYASGRSLNNFYLSLFQKVSQLVQAREREKTPIFTLSNIISV